MTHSSAWTGPLYVVLALGVAVSGCSVDEKSNKQRIDRAECLRRGYKPINDKFCNLTKTSQSDAGHVTMPDADVAMPPDAGGSMPDASMAESCKTEGMSELCYSGSLETAVQPPCHAGSRKCENHVWSACKGQVLPTTEACNGDDDDCDGRTDEGEAHVAFDCTLSDADLKGECKKGVSLCREGQVECIQVVFPGSDTCNGKDDDCDGKIDEATTMKCYDAADGCDSDGKGGFHCEGPCIAGTKDCVMGKYAAGCTGSVTPKPEQCSQVGEQRVDENCDGKTDEGCACDNGTYTCYTGSPMSTQDMLPCKAGMQVCAGGVFGSCMGEVVPQVESCANEGKDDDCNGKPDDVAIRDTSCSNVSTGKGVCKANALWKCSGGSAVCVDGAVGPSEICDTHGDDENCNGSVNEGFDLQVDPNNCGTCGNKCGAGNTCCGGVCVNTKLSNAHCGRCGMQCAAGNSCCNSACTNTKTDKSNCGTCGTTCLLSCNNGSCLL